MEKLNFKIDKEKCIHCGKCIEDCSCAVLEFDECKVPRVVQNGESKCMKCQHCFAVCPTGALSIFGKNPQEATPVTEHNPDEILKLIKLRRSIRKFKQQNLSKDLFEKLKNMLPWIPTGCNDHRLHFTFIDDISSMSKFKARTYGIMQSIFEQKPFPEKYSAFLRFKDAIAKGKDVIFRNAPHIVVVSSPVDAPCADTDPVIALSYFELYAQSLGIGTVWCGLATWCLQAFPELVKELKIPEGYKPVYCMLFGVPDVKYKRATLPEKYKITTYSNLWAKIDVLFDKIKSSFSSK